jgi:aspartokinase/homoserine dehydrogenase 1
MMAMHPPTQKVSSDLEVYKFGGTSVGGPSRMRGVASLVQAHATPGKIVVVASAMSGVTDLLVAAARAAAAGNRTRVSELIGDISTLHFDAFEELLGSAGDFGTQIKNDLTTLIDGLTEVLSATVFLGELTHRARDRILSTGEKLSIRLLALAFIAEGLTVSVVDADKCLQTDDRFGAANPLPGIADRTISSALEPSLERGEIPLVTGFCGRAPDGATTTLGRGGSDLSATVIGAALGAKAVTLWSDVDGVYSADPRMVVDARVIRQLNFREAAEMSFYGAKVLHQRTMIPVAGLGIPVRARNTMNPDAPGTTIDGGFTPGSHPVKACTAIRGQGMVSVEGKGMAGVPGMAARIFAALARRDVNVTMISQSSSEASITLVVSGEDVGRAELAIKGELRQELSRGLVEEVLVREGVGLVAAVGLGMARTPGISARVFGALAERGVNVLAIAQGSSELNISCAIDDGQVPDAVAGIHREFGLHRIDTGVDVGRHFDLVLIGCGQIGRKLLGLIRDRRAHIAERFGLTARVVCLSDRSGYRLDPTGFDDETLDAILAAKGTGQSMSEQPEGVATDRIEAVVEAALEYRLARPVVVDVSDADDSGALFRRAFELGADVVTANKKPLAGSLEEFFAVCGSEKGTGILKAEATVGAGLPVVDALEMLIATGDRVRRARGCLSGTLGFVTTCLEEGKPLSLAVREAFERGYTEPDPAVDLSGMDVARKAVILGRLSGLVRSDEPVELEGLVDSSLVGGEREALFKKLEALDPYFEDRIAQASADGKKLRYLATIEAGTIRVGLESVEASSPLGMLNGTDNMVVFETDRYDERPLVVSGPGAGADVTAMGVLGDILRIAAERG